MNIEWSRILEHDYGEEFNQSMQPPPPPSIKHAELCQYEISEMNKASRARPSARSERRSKEAYWDFLDCMAKGLYPNRYKSVFSQCTSPPPEQVDKCKDLKMDLRFEVVEALRKESAEAAGKPSDVEKAAFKGCRKLADEAQKIANFYDSDDPKIEQAKQNLLDCLVPGVCPSQVKFLKECMRSNSMSYSQCVNQSKEVVRCFALANRRMSARSDDGNFDDDDDYDYDDDDY